MWNLDDISKYKKVYEFELTEIYTWGSENDKQRREDIRAQVADDPKFPRNMPDHTLWAFRIFVRTGKKLDVGNIPKLILDAFCKKQIITYDNSDYPNVGLYPDDNINYVRLIEVGGEPAEKTEAKVEIFVLCGSDKC